MLTTSNKRVERLGLIVSSLSILTVIVAFLLWMKANGANFQ